MSELSALRSELYSISIFVIQRGTKHHKALSSPKTDCSTPSQLAQPGLSFGDEQLARTRLCLRVAAAGLRGSRVARGPEKLFFTPLHAR